MNNLENNPGSLNTPKLTPDMLRRSLNVTCECGGTIFSEKLTFKKLSILLSPSGKEELVPIPVVVCEKCGKVPSIFDSQNILPEEIKAKAIQLEK